MTDDRYSEQQPEPIACAMDTLGGITAIARTWAPGDAEKCRLCPTCTAERGLCVVTTFEDVSDADAPLFSWRGPPADGDVVAAGGLRLAE